MTLVNAETGELVDIADEKRANELAANVSSAIAHMNARTGEAIEAMADAHRERIWVSLGYGSWDDLAEARNWRFKPLTTEDRAAFGEMFRRSGMSVRGISRMLMTPKSTIADDLSGSGHLVDEVVGGDGKTYSATQPERPEPEFVDDDSDGTPDAVDAVSSPTEEVGAERASAPTPLVSAEGVAGETLPSRSLPATPSVEDHIAELRADGNWSVEFDKATRQIVAPVRYLAADVIERASAEDLADLDDRVARLNEWLDEVRALRPQGLRVINGGAS